jgi:peptide/nickel transport system permease protein
MSAATVKTRATVKAPTTRWYHNKIFQRFIRNPIAIVGLLLLFLFICLAVSAPLITAPQIAASYKGHSCARDLSFPVASESLWFYKPLTRLGLPNTQLWNNLERVPGGAEGVRLLRNPFQPYFWRLMFFTPSACYRMPQDGRKSIPIPPSADHPLGQAAGGYDIFYGMVWGGRLALGYGLMVTSIGLVLGILFGGLAGYFGGWIDTVIMRAVDVLVSFPGFVFALIFTSIFGRSMINILIAFSLVGWIGYARYFRAEILRVRELEYIDGAKSLGMPNRRIFFKHVMPNTIMIIIIFASLDIGLIVLETSGLAFLGLGGEIGVADWGQMMNFARSFLIGPTGEPFKYWFTYFWPSLAMLVFVLAWNLLGDAYRDANDPRNT